MNLIKKKKRESGMALVLVVLILSILTTMVVEFAYGIYVNTSLLDNWRRLQSVSLATESGMSIALEAKKEIKKYSTNMLFHGKELTFPNVVEEGINVSVSVIDEASKLNINSIVNPDGSETKQIEVLGRLLEALKLAPSLKDNMQDYIYEPGYGKKPMESVDELLLVAGVDRAVYNSISPFVTVYGDDGLINVNTASAVVIESLSGDILEDDAEGIVDERFQDKKTYNTKDEFTDALPLSSQEKAKVKLLINLEEGPYMIDATAYDENGMTRELRFVIKATGDMVLYWRER